MRKTARHEREPRPGSGAVGSIQAGEVLTLREFRRRLAWGDHAVRMARKAGLRLIPWGREKYVLGDDVLEFFKRLAEQQPNPNGQASEEDR